MAYRDPIVVKRALRTSVIVGTVLGVLNHGPSIITGDVTPWRLTQIALSYVVPYLVSVTSSTSAMKATRRI